MSKARERAYRDAIKKGQAAADAIGRLAEFNPPQDGSDSRLKLVRELREYCGYLDHATWWKVQSR